MASGNLFGGQYLYIVADIASFNASAVTYTKKAFIPPNFLSSLPTKTLKNDPRNVLWGAATKGVIFSVMSKNNGFKIDTAIDINPAKQNKYMAMSGVKIISPSDFMLTENNGTIIYIMNSNYYSEIVDLTKNQFQYKNVA